MSDDLLERATRELRDAYDGESKASDDTLERVLETLEAKKSAPGARVFAWPGSPKTKRTVLRTAAALAATLALTTAWAASTGRLGRIFDAGEPGEPEAPAEPQRTERGTKATSASRPPVSEETPAAQEARTTQETSVAPEMAAGDVSATAPSAFATPPVAERTPTPPPTKPAAASPSTHAIDARSTHPAQAETEGSTPIAPPNVDAPATAASAADPNDVAFERAHRLHFDGNYADALAAWDTYLQNAPNGRFAPEARFNRAIALWKLGRKSEAKQALEPFARGVYGDYRRDEARRLLDAAER